MTEFWLVVATTSSARRALRDRGPLLVSLCFYAVVSTVMSTLWRTAALGHGGSLVGYSSTQLTWYLYMSEAAIMALNVRLVEVIGDDIASGAIAVELLRPVPTLAVRVAAEVGRCLPRLAGCAVIGAALATLTAGLPPHPAALLLAAPSLVLAVTCNLIAQHAFAGVAFWIRDARSTWFLYQKLVFVLGGMLIPIQLLPPWLHTTTVSLPFIAMAYAPARLASGHVEPLLLGVQVGWLAVLGVLAWVVFSAGERQLQVVGG